MIDISRVVINHIKLMICMYLFKDIFSQNEIFYYTI